MHMAHCHMHLVSASEYWELDPVSNSIRRAIHQPKSLAPHMTIIADDLLGGYTRGYEVVDWSRSVNQPDRVFTCKCILLFYTGDYPGISKCSGCKENHCHWCTSNPDYDVSISRKNWGTEFRRFLRKIQFAFSYLLLLFTIYFYYLLLLLFVLLFIIYYYYYYSVRTVYRPSALCTCCV
jgi:hypothetical protein